MKLRKCTYRIGSIDNKRYVLGTYFFHGWYSNISEGKDYPRGLIEDSDGTLIMKDYWDIKFLDKPESAEPITAPGTDTEKRDSSDNV